MENSHRGGSKVKNSYKSDSAVGPRLSKVAHIAVSTAIIMMGLATPISSDAGASQAPSWTDSEVAATLNYGGSASITSVTCPSSTFCVAGGNYRDSSGQGQAFVSVWNGTTWTDSEVAAALNTGGYALITSVSCSSPNFCVAGGNYQDSSGNSQAFVSVWNGTTWTDSRVAASLNNGGFASITSVSCSSSTFCVAGDSSGNGQAFVSVWNGTTWTDSQVAAALYTGLGAGITSVSCSSSNFCVAGGNYKDSSGNGPAFVTVWNGTTWTDYEVAAALNARNASINSVSCSPSTICVAGGNYQDSSGNSQAFVSVWNGTTWTDNEVAAALNTRNASINSVSCSSSIFCVAGGSYLDSSGQGQAFVSVWNGTTWTDSEVAAALNTGGVATIYSVSCSSSTFCVAGGNYRDSSGNGPAFVSVNSTPTIEVGAPLNVSALAGKTQAKVSWTAPASNGGAAITSYVVTATPGGNTCSTAGALTCTVTGLQNGTSYTFTVTAANSVGTSTPSVASAPVTPATTSSAPLNVSALAGKTQAKVSWTAPASNGGAAITAYVVQYSSNGGKTWTMATTAATKSPFVVTRLTRGSSYVFRVAASNKVGIGLYSAASMRVLLR